VTVDLVVVNQVKSLKTIRVNGHIVPLTKNCNSVVASVKPYSDKSRRAALSEAKYLKSTDKATPTQFLKLDLLVLAL